MERHARVETSPALMMVKALVALGKFDEAERRLAAHLPSNPDDVEAAMTMAFVKVHLGHREEAVELLERLATRPDLPPDIDEHCTLIRRSLEFNTPVRPTRAPAIPSHDGGRINMHYQTIFTSHRSGWRMVLEAIHHLHHEQGVLFDGFLEENFANSMNPGRPRSAETLERMRNSGTFEVFADSRERGIVPYLEPWVGFLHNPPHPPSWLKNHSAPSRFMATDTWRASEEHCVGLFCLSEAHAQWVRARTDVPVNVVLHPTEFPERRWEPEHFAANDSRSVVQIGYWLRRQTAIYDLPLARGNSGNYTKVHLVPDVFAGFANDIERVLASESAHVERPGGNEAFVANTVRVDHLPNDDYDDLLSRNIVLLHLFDASANNAVIECIARCTPLLINPLPAVVEYLGEDYPFYFDSLDEAAEKACDLDLVIAAHEHMARSPMQELLTFDHFADALESSEIYQSLPEVDRK